MLIQFSNYLILVFFLKNVSVSTQLFYDLEKKAATGICISLLSIIPVTPFCGTGCLLSGVELCFLLLSSCKRHSQHRSSQMHHYKHLHAIIQVLKISFQIWVFKGYLPGIIWAVSSKEKERLQSRCKYCIGCAQPAKIFLFSREIVWLEISLNLGGTESWGKKWERNAIGIGEEGREN